MDNFLSQRTFGYFLVLLKLMLVGMLEILETGPMGNQSSKIFFPKMIEANPHRTTRKSFQGSSGSFGFKLPANSHSKMVGFPLFLHSSKDPFRIYL